MTTLAQLNNLDLAAEGVYVATETQSFAYSDGQDTEAKLARILADASDLSSASDQLEQQIDDWPSEYHLTRKRSNLLRPFNLQGIERVLELGCGCGAITRYLGEQAGVTIDAVEGSLTRATLAASRCRDLDNVRIHCGNFNELSIPESNYDLVLLVGVTEYAGRFSKRATDQEALQDLLEMAKQALTPNGVVLIAIENRLGLKYLQGACEDHYGKPWVGIENYPESSGIRTYTKPEWQHEISKAGFGTLRFCFPFPDYKVPTVVVDETDIHRDAAVHAISTTKSRDYLQAFEIKDESKLVSGFSQLEKLDQFANSFVLILAQNQSRAAEFCGFGVAEYPDHAYDWHSPQVDPNTQRLQNRLAGIAEKNEQLQAQLELLKQSRAVRASSVLRRLLRRDNAGE